MTEKMGILTSMPSRNPTSGTFELTIRCNLHCKMCLFRHDDSENAELITKELTAEKWIDIANQVAEAGTLNLLITGGEPMLRPDFCEIWKGIYKKGFLITLYTNATLVTPKIMETLREYPPHRIGVTIYGASKETYKQVCGDENAFYRMTCGVRELLSLPAQFEFRKTIIKDNLHERMKIDEFVHSEFGKQYQVTQTAMVNLAVRGGCADVESCRLSAEENQKLIYGTAINMIKSEVGDSFDPENVRFGGSDENQGIRNVSLLGCRAGMSSYTVTWDGKLIGCQMFDLFTIDLTKTVFSQAWEEFPFLVKLPEKLEICEQCEEAEFCKVCWATRFAETGNLISCPRYIKETANFKSKLIRGGKIHEIC